MHPLNRHFLSALTPLRATPMSFSSFRLIRKELKVPPPPSPGRFSTFGSVSRPAFAPGIPHPSTYGVKQDAQATAFDSVARPRARYDRPKLKATRELPEIKNRTPLYLALGVGAVSLWGAFLIYTANQERLSASIVRQCILKVKRTQNVELLEAFGETITLEPVWWMLNQPWVNGQINMPKGQIDVSIRLQGSKASGTLYFTSVRREKGAPFTILRFKVITDDGKTIHLDPKEDFENAPTV